MNRFLAGLTALVFLAVSGLAVAQDKKDDKKQAAKEVNKEMKNGKPEAGAAKDKGAKTAKAPKKKKEGC
jgi:hypothetical protein